jgi:hypothetical protein
MIDASPSKGGGVAYRLKGTYFESCSCEVVCPCGASNLVLPATYDRCLVLLAFDIQSGDVDGVDVAGNTVAMFGDTPAQMTDGNWRVGLIIDEGASEEQRAKLVSVFAGELGGPAALFAPLVGEILGIEYAAIEYADDGRRHTVRIGDAVDLEVEDFAAADEGTVMTMTGAGHPAGKTLALAQTTKGKINVFGLEVDNTGRNGHSAPFSWAA